MRVASRRLTLLVTVLAAGLLLGMTPGNAPAPAASERRAAERVSLVQVETPVGPVQRTYFLAVPPGPDIARPLVIVLHGRSQTPGAAMRYSGMEELGSTEGFVTVFPSSYAGAWNAGTCCAAGDHPDMPDVEFLDHVVADVRKRTPVDPSRVHMVGFSNGGMLAYRYACQRPGRLAGVGVVAGAMSADAGYADAGPQRCRPDVPVSVVAVHGAKDTTVPYDGGTVAGTDRGAVAPVRAGIDQFAVAGACSTHRSSRVGGTARLDYAGCTGGVAARLVKINDFGHGWTRDAARHGYDTSRGLWDFLRDKRSAGA
ncbi:MAG: hypothetical protein JWN57_1093 [Frankiales bacterium]|nr:hypothetical protein [Frankiales bacterium]